MPFLRAEWNDLLLANYAVEPDFLRPYVPPGTDLDLFEGRAFLSLVAFMFGRTRVLGVPVPGHTDFEEVNLRLYVKPLRDPGIRAVTFIKEIVPKRAIPAIANSLFNENYVCMPMGHAKEGDTCSYSWDSGVENRFAAEAAGELALPPPGSVGEFITEHYWGYAGGKRHTLEYKVEHPPWIGTAVSSYDISVDFASSYGAEFAFLKDTEPHNVQYARGSEVTVSSPRRLREGGDG